MSRRPAHLVAWLVLLLGVAGGGGPAAAADLETLAVEAYRAGRYDEGIEALRAALPELAAGQGRGGRSLTRAEALYLLGRLELRRGELSLEFARAGRSFAVDYLARLAAGPTRLHYAPYFLGVARREAGDRRGAAAALKEALRRIPRGAKGDEAVVRQLAGIALASLDGGVPALPAGADPRVAAEVGWLLAKSGRDVERGRVLAERALARIARQGGRLPAPVLRAVAGVRLAAGRLDEALAILDGEGAYRPAAIERAGPHYRVAYYDLPALALGADATLRAAARDLEAALAADGAAGLPAAARFAAARARLLAGEPRAALEALGRLGAPGGLGDAGRARVLALSGRARAALGETGEAVRLWREALAAAGSDSVALGELAEAVAEVHPCAAAPAPGCTDSADPALREVAAAVLARAAPVAEEGPRRALQSLAAGLGWLTLVATGDARLAVAQFERARDKGAKNRLDANDPVFLARLAQAQVKARLFSEALEIYFEMGKTYPEVRQVQEALQGIYAAEQVAAGEAKLN